MLLKEQKYFNKHIKKEKLKIQILNKELEKVKYYRKKIELNYLSKFSPPISFLILSKYKNLEVIDLFEKYSYLNPTFVTEKLTEKNVFPPNSFSIKDIEDIECNIFEIPY